MRTRVVQRACIQVGVLAVLLATGCGERQPSSIQPTQSQTANLESNSAVKALETQVGMTFPTNTVLLNATDGGGRDASYGFYAWGLFSPTAIKMPPMKAPGVKDYLNLPLEGGVLGSVQGMMGERKISQAQAAFTSDWETNGYKFRGTLIRSPQGDHLLIERFRKR